MSYTPPTPEEVREVSGTTVENLDVHIETAGVIITEYLVPDGRLSETVLNTLGKYLASHFAFILGGQVRSETIGATATTFNITTGLGLLSTTFGQQAMLLDFTGTLAQLNSVGVSAGSSTDSGDQYTGYAHLG